MFRTIRGWGALAMLSVGLLLLIACATTDTAATPAPDEPQAASAGDKPGEPKAAPAAGEEDESEEDKARREKKEAREKAKKARERERKLARLQRRLEVAELNLDKTRMSMEHSAVSYRVSMEKAHAELEIARRELHVFNEIEAPNRIARGELGLQWADDRALEARQELEQLEIMYKDDQFADKTKEIVIERARRSLQRTERDLELRREEFNTLKETTLPMERQQKELALVGAEESVARLERDREAAKIGERVGLINAELEVVQLANEISDTEDEIREAAEDEAEEKAAKAKAESAKE